mmetsp:Transcript_13088/g.22088  ORF Transcript_13088/g.22088 Transcript_13088/m.22088 type:complete len:291 (+) Transcript_13088:622-1494(+)
MFGSLLGGFMTEYFHPSYSFLLYSLFGLVVMLLGFNLDPEAEEDVTAAEDEKGRKRAFLEEVRHNLSQIRGAIKLPEVYQTLVFFLLVGLVEPSFGDFWYYFQLNVIKFTKFQYAMFGVLGYASLSLGTLYYNLYLKEHEVRTLLKWACYMGVVGSLLSLFFVLRWNLACGISDIFCIVFTDIVLGTLGLAYSQLPTMVLFAKITPSSIEATFFAFLTGTLNFSNTVMRPLVGSMLNDYFVGVTAEDLSQFYVLCLVSMATSLIPFTFLHLVPLKEEIKQWQEGREKVQE